MVLQMLPCHECYKTFTLKVSKLSAILGVEWWTLYAFKYKRFRFLEYYCKATFETPCIANFFFNSFISNQNYSDSIS
jgi:hypothetical protein